jgi:hypothetical protein
MATNIISVSVPMELAQFLEENPEISPSKIIQTKLFEMKNDEARLEQRIKAYEIRNGRISAKLNKVLEWVEEQKLVIPDNVLE